MSGFNDFIRCGTFFIAGNLFNPLFNRNFSITVLTAVISLPYPGLFPIKIDTQKINDKAAKKSVFFIFFSSLFLIQDLQKFFSEF
jgi:hypothetical protein